MLSNGFIFSFRSRKFVVFSPENKFKRFTVVWRRIGWQTYLTTLVSANPLSLCVPMACEQDRHAA
uniref:Transposase n=1 Tax=Mesocestoides corti TaxID=53468 RepID=A0A5K3G7Q1_MESCO